MIEILDRISISISILDLPAAAVTHLVVAALLGVALSLLAVNEVESLGLDLAINEGTGETGNNLLGLSVVVDLACGLSVQHTEISGRV